MTRKDYKLIARALYQSKPERNWPSYGKGEVPQWVQDRNAICEALATDNPRFDPVKFLSACNEG